MNSQTTQKQILRNRALAYLVAAALVYLVTYRMSLKEALLPFHSDMVTHMEYGLALHRVVKLTHNGWHLVCWLIYAALPIDITTAAGITTGLFNALTALLCCMLFDRMFRPDYRSWTGPVLTAAVTFGALMVGPLYLRFFNDRYYLGQGTPNPWHNPTSTGVRPFALLITLLTVDYWALSGRETIQIGKRLLSKGLCMQLWMAVILAFGTLIKPSILMVYLPACFLIALWRLIRSRGRAFGRLIVQHLYLLPAALVMLWQYLSIFLSPKAVSSGDSGIIIDLFWVAKLYSDNFILSLILRMAFPFAIILLWGGTLFADSLFRLTFLEYLWGLAITWIFRETGHRATHGNLGWGNVLACSLLWIYCIFFYVKQLRKDLPRLKDPALPTLKIKYLVPAVLLLWHLIAGLCYYGSLLHNMSAQL